MTDRKPTEALVKCRISYPALFKPKKQKDSTVEKYGAQLIIDKNDKETVDAVKRAIVAAKKIGIAEKWKGKVPVGFKSPLRDGDAQPTVDDDGDEIKSNPHAKGCFFMNGSNTRKPGVLKRENGQNVPAAEEEVYPGCQVYASVNFFAYNEKSNGVACSLNNILKIKDMPRFDGGRTAEEDFQDLDFEELEELDFEDEDIDDLL